MDTSSSIESSATCVVPATRVRYGVLAIFCAAAAIGYIDRYSINLLATPIQKELGLNKDQMGWVMASFFAAYALMQLPAGWTADRWGSRCTLTVCALLWSSATAAMSSASGLRSLLVIWAIMGAAQAGLFPCAVTGLRRWLPASRRAMASGMLATFMNVGAVLSPLTVGVLLTDMTCSWREVFLWLAVPGVLWAIAFGWWYRDRPDSHRAVNAEERRLIGEGSDGAAANYDGPRSAARQLPWRRLALSAGMWLICAQHFLRAAAQVFFGTWFGTFLFESPGISSDQVKVLASLPPLVLIGGSLIGGFLSDWLLSATGSRRVSRQWLAVVNLLLCAAMFLMAAVLDNSWLRVTLICAGCLWMSIGGVSAYTITMDLGGPFVATVFSTMNMCGSFGAAAFPKYVGWLMDRTGRWDYVLFSIAAVYVAAACCWALLNPDRSLFDEEK